MIIGNFDIPAAKELMRQLLVDDYEKEQTALVAAAFKYDLEHDRGVILAASHGSPRLTIRMGRLAWPEGHTRPTIAQGTEVVMMQLSPQERPGVPVHSLRLLILMFLSGKAL